MATPSVVGPTPPPSRSPTVPPAAKLAPPALPRATLPRPRLHGALSRAVRAAPLTLVRGPAGSGKTTLAASWWFDEADRRALAWYSVDGYDDDPTVFWTAVVEALAGAGVPRDELPSLPAGALPPWFVPELAARLAGLERPVVLVLDDADRLTDPAVVDGIDLLVRTAGSGLRLVLCSRAEPHLPLHRHRLAGTVAEIGGDRLAFTPEETHALLAELAVPVSPETAAALCAETGGWAVGVRLAAVPLRRGAPLERPATALARDDGEIARYLTAEVLERLPPGTRRFLLRVSTTADLWPDLVTRLTGTNGVRMLGALAHANAFVEAAPDAPGGYRIHPLLRETLRSQLAFERPGEVAGLHRTAARWYADAGRTPEAVEHALAADDRDLVAQLLLDELVAARWLARGTDATWRRVEQPLASGRGEDAAVLRAAAAVADGRDPDPRDLTTAAAVRHEAGRPALRASAALTVLADTARHGDAAALADAATADPLVHALPVDEQREALAVLRVGSALAELGTDEAGDRVRAELRSAAATARDAGAVAVRSRAVADLAVLEALDGDLDRALRLAAESDERAAEIGGTGAALQPGAAIATAWAHLQRYTLARAVDWAGRARNRAGADADAVATAPVLAVLEARLHRLHHEHDEAGRDLAPWLTAPALPRWAREHVLGEAVLLAIARGDPAAGRALLDYVTDGADAGWYRRLSARLALLQDEPVPPAAEAEPGSGVVAHVEALLLRASGQLVAGREPAAVETLVTALDLARPGLLRLPFLDAPPPARRALRSLPRLREHARWLNPAAPPGPAEPHPPAVGETGPPVVEELSAREAEVLRHLAELLSTEEIAATMFVSVNTVRTHIRSILRKLGVARRNDAVRRARELQLL